MVQSILRLVPGKERRKHPRQGFERSVQLTWTDPQGRDTYARGKCVDVSSSGLGIVGLAQPIPPGTLVYLRIEGLNFTCSAIVRHSTRRGNTYGAGLELRDEGQMLRQLAGALQASASEVEPKTS